MIWRLLCIGVVAVVCMPADEAPALELNTELMQATVRLDGMTAEGPKVATGFIMGRPIPSNPKRAQFVLITANHVLDDFKSHVVALTTRKPTASGGWERVTVNLPIRALVSNFRVQDAVKTAVARGADLAVISGATRYDLKLKNDSLTGIRDAIDSLNLGLQAHIRQDAGGFQLRVSVPDPNVFVPTQLVRVAKTGPEPLLSETQFWTRHPQADVAAMYIRLPVDVLPSILPTTLLAEDEGLKAYGLHPGDELNCLGYPLGAESNPSGFPILRSGKIASYPLLPTT